LLVISGGVVISGGGLRNGRPYKLPIITDAGGERRGGRSAGTSVSITCQIHGDRVISGITSAENLEVGPRLIDMLACLPLAVMLAAIEEPVDLDSIGLGVTVSSLRLKFPTTTTPITLSKEHSVYGGISKT
jgi:hypothetical protein